MPDYTYQGAEKAYVPSISKWVEPGDTVEFPKAPNNAAFVAAHGTKHTRPAHKPATAPQADAATTDQPATEDKA